MPTITRQIGTRDNFSTPIVETLKKRAAFICSNPACKVMTIAPSIEDKKKVQYIGIAAHITAAAKSGPRYDEALTEADRMAITNAIFLCSNCASMIDKNNGIDYSTETLHKWKNDHDKWVLDSLNKTTVGLQSLNINSTSENQSGGITAGVVNVDKLNINPIDDKREHDKQIFREADKLFNEDNLNLIMQSLLCDESIWSPLQDKLEEFKYFFEKSSTEYLTEEVENTKITLISSLKELLNFLAYEFDIYPRDQQMEGGYKICMRPDLNIDRKGIDRPGEFEAHIKLRTRLREVTTKLEEDFKKYRKKVKVKLYV